MVQKYSVKILIFNSVMEKEIESLIIDLCFQMEIPDGLLALNFTADDVPNLVKGAIPQVWKYTAIFE